MSDCRRVAHVKRAQHKTDLGFSCVIGRMIVNRPRFGRVSVSISKYYIPFTQGASVIVPVTSFAVTIGFLTLFLILFYTVKQVFTGSVTKLVLYIF